MHGSLHHLGSMNLFLKYAENLLPRKRGKPRPLTVLSEREAPMVLRAAEKSLAERSKQFARGKRWSAARFKELLTGEHGNGIKRLIRFLHKMDIDQGEALLTLLDELAWFNNADRELRLNVLSEIDDCIITLRICNGYPPVDDSLPGEAPTIFEIVKRKLNPEDGVTYRDKNWDSC
jgi:hypothetical protein